MCAAAAAVHAEFMADRNLKRTGHVRNYYDGPAFLGLPPGQIGSHGALTRTDTLVFTDVELDAAYDNRRPIYLDGPTALPAGSPVLFCLDTRLPARRRERCRALLRRHPPAAAGLSSPEEPRADAGW